MMGVEKDTVGDANVLKSSALKMVTVEKVNAGNEKPE